MVYSGLDSLWYNLYEMYRSGDNMERVSVAEARRNLAELITRVGFGGKRVVIERHGKPVLALISYADLLRLQALEESEAPREGWRLALEQARAASARILSERKGEYLPDSADVIRDSREERTDELTDHP
jgi:prevent-host-death family protein